MTGGASRKLSWKVALLGPVAGLLLGLPAAGAAAQAPRAGGAASWRDKVAPEVLAETSSGPAEFIVFLSEQADLSAASGMPTKAQKGVFVYRALREVAERAQAPVLEQLRLLGAQVRPFWVADMILVMGDERSLEAMARRPDVRRVMANPRVRLAPPPSEVWGAQGASPAGVEWNVARVRAPQAWALGFKGQGVVVGICDTGTDWTHPTLKGHYRGWDGSSADHNYNWHDAIHTPAGKCGADVPYPCDDYGHGTPVAGIAVGDDGAGNQIGVAPGAKWIACRCMDKDGWGSVARYTECLQWFIAPTDLAGQNPDPSKAPDLTNNSWGCVAEEGCTDPLVLKSVVESVKAAGITVVAAAGNEGPGCSTTGDPPASYEAAFDVGATDQSDQVTSFSSRGPALDEGRAVVKPDVVAPGSYVRSCKAGGGYITGGGTSAASPHAAGVMALLISANPNLAGRVSDAEAIVRMTASPKTTSESCGGVPGSQRPNNTFGWGLLDAFAAVQASCTVECETTVPSAATTGVPAAFKVQASTAGVCGAGTIAYDWDFGDGGAHASDQNPSHTYAAPGTYTWILTASLGEVEGIRTGSIAVTGAVVPPTVAAVRKLGSPFRLRIDGTGFQAGAHVTIGGATAPWSDVTLTGSTSLTLGAGSALKAQFPKGQSVPIRIANPDGGEADTTYTRP